MYEYFRNSIEMYRQSAEAYRISLETERELHKRTNMLLEAAEKRVERIAAERDGLAKRNGELAGSVIEGRKECTAERSARIFAERRAAEFGARLGLDWTQPHNGDWSRYATKPTVEERLNALEATVQHVINKAGI